MSKTVDDLARIYDDAYEDRARLEFPTPEMKRAMHRAGIAAVVRALRREIWTRIGCVEASDIMNEILGDTAEARSAGVLAVESREGAMISEAPEAPATDPAPACEWWVERDPDGDGHYETKCQNGWTLLHGKPSLDGYSFCPSCGKPIKFAEVK